MQLVAEGHTSAEAASRLSIGTRTVEMHRANLMRKLRVRNQAELIRYAFQRGILSLEDGS
jgi:DNA-binding CsgD family transcriptional regulator